VPDGAVIAVRPGPVVGPLGLDAAGVDELELEFELLDPQALTTSAITAKAATAKRVRETFFMLRILLRIESPHGLRTTRRSARTALWSPLDIEKTSAAERRTSRLARSN
jgi:hypothetical protein